jgi:hypothetical protein
MISRKWLSLTLLLTLVGAGGFVLLNVGLDIHGLFRDPRGRQLPIYDSERSGKYLLGGRYVPSNFEAILVGTSVSATWKTGGLTAFRTYNESTDGGNITEEKALAERALLSPGLQIAICVVHPYLTDTHGLNTEEMTDREYQGALGSTTLLRSYRLLLMASFGREKLVWDADGAEDVEAPTELNPVLRRILAPGAEIHVDEAAFEEYRALVSELRAHGLRLIAVVPPTRDDLLEPKRAAMDRYTARIWALFSPGDRLIDFNGPEYAAFRRDRDNYRDGVHFSRRGAAAMVELLDRQLLAWRAQAELKDLERR